MSTASNECIPVHLQDSSTLVQRRSTLIYLTLIPVALVPTAVHCRRETRFPKLFGDFMAASRHRPLERRTQATLTSQLLPIQDLAFKTQVFKMISFPACLHHLHILTILLGCFQFKGLVVSNIKEGGNAARSGQ